MAKTFQFGEFEDGGAKKPPPCMACEDMLADALDGTLDAVGPDGGERGWFDRHIAGCAACSTMLADAQRGAAWLELLKTPRPEPSAQLLERILAQTAGQTGAGALLDSGAMETALRPEMVPAVLPQLDPSAVPVNVLAFRPRRSSSPRSWSGAMFEPRLAMTAAMAFFSLALTMNLTGVKLNDLRLSSLRPKNLKHSYYEANANAVRYYDNLRVVRVLESRVEDLRQSGNEEQPARAVRQTEPKRDAPPAPTETKPEPKQEKGPGVSRRDAPLLQGPRMEWREERVRQAAGVGGRAKAGLSMEGGLV